MRIFLAELFMLGLKSIDTLLVLVLECLLRNYFEELFEKIEVLLRAGLSHQFESAKKIVVVSEFDDESGFFEEVGVSFVVSL